MQGDDHVGACMGNKPETVCYEEGNKGSFQNFFSDTARISVKTRLKSSQKNPNNIKILNIFARAFA